MLHVRSRPWVVSEEAKSIEQAEEASNESNELLAVRAQSIERISVFPQKAPPPGVASNPHAFRLAGLFFFFFFSSVYAAARGRRRTQLGRVPPVFCASWSSAAVLVIGGRRAAVAPGPASRPQLDHRRGLRRIRLRALRRGALPALRYLEQQQHLELCTAARRVRRRRRRLSIAGEERA